MRLYGAAMIRNEADIVEAFVRHNLTVLDGLAIVDHGSCDGTSEVLASLAAEGLPIAVSSDATAGWRTRSDAMASRLLKYSSSRAVAVVASRPASASTSCARSWRRRLPDQSAAATTGSRRMIAATATCRRMG